MSGIGSSDLIGRAPGGRKLIAVVHADMVGYSRLIELDDIGTLERLRILRQALIDPAISEHGGKIVQTGGDSLLIVFDSIEGAVRYAVHMQRHLPDYDGDKPADRAIRFRVGINIGDVIADGTDLHGESVNVAVRLQAECPPGGICVSRAVRDHVHGRLDLIFEELGALNLKNIGRPIEAFALSGGDGAMTAPKSAGKFGAGNKPESPLLNRPSIAVLAFANMSDDPDQEYFSDGVTDDIITALSRSRSLFVIARNSSFTYKKRAVDVKQVARELGVRYVVEGSVRQSGDRMRINAQLVDAEIGSHIWAERFDRRRSDIFALQDEITSAVVAAIDPAISRAEQQRAMQKPLEDLSTWEAWHRARWHWSRNELSTARAFLQRATVLDPGFALAHAWQGWLHLLEATQGVGPGLQESAGLAEAEARSALELDPDSAVAHAVLARAFFYQGDGAAGLEEVEIALALNQNDPQSHLAKGRFLVFSGTPAAAREPLATALALDPRGPTAPTAMFQNVIGRYFERDYPGAEAMARGVIRTFPQYPSSHLWLAAALGRIGRTDEARVALDTAISSRPEYFKFSTDSRPLYYRPEDHELLLEGLRKAGWQG